MKLAFLSLLLPKILPQLIDLLVYDPSKHTILPGDNLMIFLRLRHQLYLSVDDGIVVLNNSLLNDELIDTVLPISIRKLDESYYEIFIDGYNICSYGSFSAVTECGMDISGDPKWTMEGDDNLLTIQGKGGCLARYSSKGLEDNFKHGVRVEFCNGKDDQKWAIQRNLII